MTKLEQLRQEISDNSIALDEFCLPHSVSISHMDDNGDYYIAIDKARIASSAEEEVRLLHEMGHCKTGSFYCRHSTHERRERLEARANRWAIRKRLPIDILRQTIKARRPRNNYELADELGLTLDFVYEAIRYYTETWGLDLGVLPE